MLKNIKLNEFLETFNIILYLFLLNFNFLLVLYNNQEKIWSKDFLFTMYKIGIEYSVYLLIYFVSLPNPCDGTSLVNSTVIVNQENILKC